MKPDRAVLDVAVQVLRREGYCPIAVAIPAVQGGRSQPDYAVAFCGDRHGTGYEVVWVDAEGVTGHWYGDDLLGGYGEFVTMLYTGEPAQFSVDQRRG